MSHPIQRVQEMNREAAREKSQENKKPSTIHQVSPPDNPPEFTLDDPDELEIRDQRKGFSEKVGTALDTTADSIERTGVALAQLIKPYFFALINGVIPGLGLVFLGRWGKGIFNFLICLFLFLVNSMIIYSVKNIPIGQEDALMLRALSPILPLSACYAYAAARAHTRSHSPSLWAERTHNRIQLVTVPVMNALTLIAGFWLLGRFWTGILNFVLTLVVSTALCVLIGHFLNPTTESMKWIAVGLTIMAMAVSGVLGYKAAKKVQIQVP